MKLLQLGLLVIWFSVDQLTKWWAVENLIYPIRIAPFFDLVLSWNRGISFGMLSSHPLPSVVLASSSGAIAIGLLIWLFRTGRRFVGTGLAIIIGGALGNAVDRVRHGAVVDFLDLHLAGWHWPTFNIADVGVVCGTAILIVDSFVDSQPDAKSGTFGS